MPGAERSIIVHTPPAVLYQVITDYERYSEFLDDVSAVRVLERTGNTLLAEYQLNLIKKISYVIRLTERPHSEVSWTLVRSRIMKSNVGGWRLEDLGDGRTRAHYHLAVTVGGFVPGRIVDRLTGTTLPATLQAFKARAESR